MADCMLEMMASSWRKWTSCFVGWTLTSTFCGAISTLEIKIIIEKKPWDPVSQRKSRQRQRLDPDLWYLCFVNHKTGFCSLKNPSFSCDKTWVLILTLLWANSCSHTDYLTNIIGQDQNNRVSLYHLHSLYWRNKKKRKSFFTYFYQFHLHVHSK